MVCGALVEAWCSVGFGPKDAKGNAATEILWLSYRSLDGLNMKRKRGSILWTLRVNEEVGLHAYTTT